MREHLNYATDHVFIPSKLPQEDDDSVTNGALLVEEVLTALKLFQAQIPVQERSEWTSCIKMVDNMLQIRDHFGSLMAEKVELMLMRMVDGGTNVPALGNIEDI